MNYAFPAIRTLDDVLPHVEGFDEIVVADRDWYTVVNYVVAMPKTFHMEGSDDLGGAIRRECRGLVFDSATRELVSRPFHKFFNVGEKDETQPHLVDLARGHELLTKMDGSMVRPIVRPDGSVGLGTRMGLTDVGAQAERLLYTDVDEELSLAVQRRHWLRRAINVGLTPILEYVAPTNKIVLRYDEPELVLLAVRDTFTGVYQHLQHFTGCPFRKVEVHPAHETVESLVAHTRALTGAEGYVVRFHDGHMLKIKADEYVRIHKIKDLVRTDRNVLDLMVNDQLDDAVGVLDAEDYDRVREYERVFWRAFNDKIGHVEGLVDIARTVYAGDKKRIATELNPSLVDKRHGRFIFSAIDGRSVRDELLKLARASVGGTTKYNELMDFLGMETER